MLQTDKDGVSTRKHLQQVMRQTGTPPKDLIGPKKPETLEYVWQIFLALHYSRKHGEGGPDPLSYTEMKALCDLHRLDLVDWEINLVKTLDATYISVRNEKAR